MPETEYLAFRSLDGDRQAKSCLLYCVPEVEKWTWEESTIQKAQVLMFFLLLFERIPI